LPAGAPLFGPKSSRRFLLLRAGAQWLTMLLWWSALSSLPIGDATAIVFMSPLWSNLFAATILGERCIRALPIQATLCVAGVLLIAQPPSIFSHLPLVGPSLPQRASHDEAPGEAASNQASKTLGACFALGASLAAGLSPSIVRLCHGAAWQQFEMVAAVCNGLILTPAAVLVQLCARWWTSELAGPSSGACDDVLCWRWELRSGLTAGSIGLILISANVCHTRGYQLTLPTRAAMVAYIEVPFAMATQWLLFGDAPNALSLLGSGLIVASCLLGTLEVALLSTRHPLPPTEVPHSNSLTALSAPLLEAASK
jgi:drug/metabolite transporter (DMT)-like permease